jgi:hypothetical protein
MNNKELLIQSIIFVMAIIGLVYGRLISIPDAVNRFYGLPINWGFIN